MAMLLIPLVCALSLWSVDLLSGVSLLVRERAAGAGLSYPSLLPGMVEAGELVVLKLVLGLTSLLLSLLLAWYLSLLRGGEEVEFLLTARRMVLVSTLVFTSSHLLLSALSL
jgi:hypothetical protein